MGGWSGTALGAQYFLYINSVFFHTIPHGHPVYAEYPCGLRLVPIGLL